MPKRRVFLGLALITVSLSAVTGCKKEPTEQPEAPVKPAEPAAAETPEQSCTRMLSRFGEDIVEAETEACVAALTSGTELEVCREASLEAEYLECVGSCMDSVTIDPAEYDPSDSSTSPVVNCAGGCVASCQ
jgi:hypothetical protein